MIDDVLTKVLPVAAMPPRSSSSTRTGGAGTDTEAITAVPVDCSGVFSDVVCLVVFARKVRMASG